MDSSGLQTLAKAINDVGISCEQLNELLRAMIPGGREQAEHSYALYLRCISWEHLLEEKPTLSEPLIKIWQNEYDRRTLLRSASPPIDALLRPAGFVGTKDLVRAVK